MKLLIIDLYGDGEAIRACEDTPKNNEAVKAFQSADYYFCKTGEGDAPSFTDFCEERGVTLFETRRINLDINIE